MIKRKSEIEAKVVSNQGGVIGNITIFNFLTEQEARGAGRAFAKVIIEPGGCGVNHTHEGDMEAYYILKGRGIISDDGVEVTLEEGDCHICPDGHAHFMKNAGDEPLEFIAIILYTKQKSV